MLTLSPAYLAHARGTVTQFCTCWKVVRKDSLTLGFTDHPSDLVIGGLTYQSALGYSSTDVQSSADLAVDNLNLTGFIESPSITEPDLIAGLWDFAEVTIFEAIYSNLSAGTRTIARGRIGEVSLGRTSWEAELRGLSQSLTQQLLELTSPLCRVKLGSAKCGVALGPLTVTGSITSIANRRTWTDSTRAEAAGHFTYGLVSFTSGANAGFSIEVKAHTAGGVIEQQLPLPYALAVGDAYTMTPGCDRRFTTCSARYSNVINFRGEPHLPGQDALFKGP